ncbi:GNAT family N-acetyltransferase [Actinophytocola sediminis]
MLIGHLRDQAAAWKCARLYLTSEPENTAAQAAWESMGFANVGGDHLVNGVPIVTDFKGPGKHRAVYQLPI